MKMNKGKMKMMKKIYNEYYILIYYKDINKKIF